MGYYNTTRFFSRKSPKDGYIMIGGIISKNGPFALHGGLFQLNLRAQFLGRK